ncbi:hypothetical protein NM688_g7482 [Phlebia brevispora]|uniref:Uncharacterized protein n=1 Tax=Phlebia brevispora TaxID=194682 RepID=A0ACC1S4Y4_9APHY|nr:hypothetical protein NM688_g7482 [Phlebia brevispora]
MIVPYGRLRSFNSFPERTQAELILQDDLSVDHYGCSDNILDDERPSDCQDLIRPFVPENSNLTSSFHGGSIIGIEDTYTLEPSAEQPFDADDLSLFSDDVVQETLYQFVDGRLFEDSDPWAIMNSRLQSPSAESDRTGPGSRALETFEELAFADNRAGVGYNFLAAKTTFPRSLSPLSKDQQDGFMEQPQAISEDRISEAHSKDILDDTNASEAEHASSLDSPSSYKRRTAISAQPECETGHELSEILPKDLSRLVSSPLLIVEHADILNPRGSYNPENDVLHVEDQDLEQLAGAACSPIAGPSLFLNDDDG